MHSAMKKWKKIKQIFSEALELEGEERHCFLADACGENEELRSEVESLIRAHESTGALDRSLNTIRLTAVHSAKQERVKGKRVGNYRIAREVGHGGMGAVYLAERDDGQFEQQAALKLLHSPFASDEELKRFRSERQILATLNHENIARLLDGGITEDGQPYYVMEYVDGLPLDAYCDKHKLNIEERLRLFQDVVSAVQYAHRKLVVHRDLKPPNILVTKEGRVKLLDFGIAKFLDGKGPFQTDLQLTQPGLLPITPSYASPEQIRGDSITTASDIYQLGLVLYELLCGLRPYDVSGKSPGQLENIICGKQPSVPARRLTELKAPDDIHKICEQRSTGLKKLQKNLSGDLEAIIMKTLRKEPDRRYESAEQLLDDIGRYLEGEPVKAHPDSKLYRVKKFLARNAVVSTAATLIVLLLAGYLVTITWHSHQTQKALERAESEAEKSAQVVDFMIGMFEAGDPRAHPGDEITVGKLIERGLEEANRLDNQPELQANMFNVIGKVYTSLGRYDDAAEILGKAVDIQKQYSESNAAETARYLNDYGYALSRMDMYDEALTYHAEALDIMKALYGEKHPEVANAMLRKGYWMPVAGTERAYELRRKALGIRRDIYGENHLLTAEAYMQMGKVQRSRAEPREAIEFFERALEIRKDQLGTDHPDVAESMIFLGDVYRLYDIDTHKAETLYRQALQIQENTLSLRHSSRLHGLSSLAGLLSEKGDHSEAIELYRENLEIRWDIFGETHPSIAEGKGQLAAGYSRMGDFENAESYYRKSLDMWVDLMGPGHNTVRGALTGLGNLMTEMDRYDEAEAYYKRALAIHRENFGENSGSMILGSIGRMYRKQGEFEEARRYYRRAISLLGDSQTSEHYDVVQLRNEYEELLVVSD